LKREAENPTFEINSITMKIYFYALCVFLLTLTNCKKAAESIKEDTYAYDADFIRKHTANVIELSDAASQSKVLLSVDYQGRVMTSTASGNEGSSYGWINYSLIASGEKKKQFNPVGGEERFWLGPEGGQYSLYFHSGDSFSIKNWQVPPVIDTEAFEVMESSLSSATFSRRASLTNYTGTEFDLLIERKISLLTKTELESELGTQLPEKVKYVGYKSENKIQNAGSNDWEKQSGLLSIWLLGMFTPSDQTTVIIPFKPATNAKDLITTTYFGEVPAERLSIKDSVLFFTCDGKYRSKIGLSPIIAKPVSASFDFQKNILTVTRFEIASEASYVNSKWEIQEAPFTGDAVNSYNDGPLADGSQLGPFYELESSSKALALKAGEADTFRQVTCHFEGDFEKLNDLSIKILGVDLNTIKK
jgi:hypothetical protein